MLLFETEFGSLYSYVPSLYGKRDHPDPYNFMLKLKQDKVLEQEGAPVSEAVAKAIRASLDSLPFKDYFGEGVFLVPAPSHSKHSPRLDSLSNVRNIVIALEKEKLGVAFDCIERTETVTKSATASSDQRPNVHIHYESIRVKRSIHNPSEIVVVDDIVTTGSTLLACTNRLHEVYPEARIRVFAIMRSMSPPSSFVDFKQPCVGKIRFDGNRTIRYP